MGIPISEASYVYGDNMLVIRNTSRPESSLKEKGSEIAYHAIHKSVAMGATLTGHIRSENNPADALTKTVTKHKQKHLALLMSYGIYDGDTYQNHFMSR